MCIRIRPFHPADARRVADLHTEGIPQGFLSQLGPQLLELLYEGIAEAPRSGIWVTTRSEKVVGFICGTLDVHRCYRAVLLRRGPRLVWRIVPELVKISTWKQVFETLLYPLREIGQTTSKGDPSTAKAEPTAELLSIAVAREARGSGAAHRLVEAMETAFRQWGHTGPYRVVTVSSDPRSNAFYRKLGFTFARRFRHHGHEMNIYHMNPDRRARETTWLGEG